MSNWQRAAGGSAEVPAEKQSKLVKSAKQKQAAEAPSPDPWLKTMTRVCKGPWPEVRGLLVKRIFNFDNNGPLKKREEFLKEKKHPGFWQR